MRTIKSKGRPALRLLAILGLSCSFGCNHDTHSSETGPVEQILPSQGVVGADAAGVQQNPPQGAGDVKQVALQDPIPPRQVHAVPAVSTVPAALPPPPDMEARSAFRQTLDLPNAINLAFRTQPRLKAALESIQQARAKEDIAFSAFLPLLSAGYSVGAFDINVGGTGIPVAGNSLRCACSRRRASHRP